MAKTVKTITSLQHPLIKHWVKLRKNRDYRHDHHSVMIVGVHTVHEVCPHTKTKVLIATHETLLPKDVKAQEAYIVSDAIMRKISGLETPEGIMAEVAMPAPTDFKKYNKILILDGISDPGNLGALLRTALALGWDAAYLLENSCDPYNDKALRAAKGATFRLPLAMGTWDDVQPLIKGSKWQCLAADLEGVEPHDVPKAAKRALILGNEAHGISKTAQKLSTQVTIPMSGNMESLNVSIAGGILMYLLAAPQK